MSDDEYRVVWTVDWEGSGQREKREGLCEGSLASATRARDIMARWPQVEDIRIQVKTDGAWLDLEEQA